MRRARVIDALRRAFPGPWSYSARDFPRWDRGDGSGVEAFAELAPRFDGDDDSFRTCYRWVGGELSGRPVDASVLPLAVAFDLGGA